MHEIRCYVNIFRNVWRDTVRLNIESILELGTMSTSNLWIKKIHYRNETNSIQKYYEKKAEIGNQNISAGKNSLP